MYFFGTATGNTPPGKAMNTNKSTDFFSKPPKTAATGPLGKILAVVGGAALMAIGLMFSLVALAVLLVAGALIVAYFYWQSRHLRRHLQQQMADRMPRPPGRNDDANAAANDDVIEGEVIRETDDHSRPTATVHRLNVVPSRDSNRHDSTGDGE